MYERGFCILFVGIRTYIKCGAQYFEINSRGMYNKRMILIFRHIKIGFPGELYFAKIT